MEPEVLAALAEPNRLRIVQLLAESPRPVGEVARLAGLRQPQATKHLQRLERAGLVVVHPLGQRRIYALRRGPLRELRDAVEALAVEHPSERVLAEYEAAIATERPVGRVVRFRRTLPGSRDAVWERFTSAAAIRRWWAPEHFRVAACDADPVPGGVLRIVLEEGDGTQHVAAGTYLEVHPPQELRFGLAPVAADGSPLFAATHRVRLAALGRETRLSLVIRVDEVVPGAEPVLAGIRPGWEQLLAKLADDVRLQRPG
jgi:uncharacterized protein YndB with AHSA1/START domain/DNA-binding transcriptional ArsR family regulator